MQIVFPTPTMCVSVRVCVVPIGLRRVGLVTGLEMPSLSGAEAPEARSKGQEQSADQDGRILQVLLRNVLQTLLRFQKLK